MSVHRSPPGLSHVGGGDQAEMLRRHLALLRDACAMPLGIDELLAACARQARAAVDADGAVLFGVHDGDLVVVASHGFPPRLAAPGTRLPLDDATAAGFAAGHDMAVWVSDHREKMARFPAMRRSPVLYQALAALPIIRAGKIVGVLGISFDRPHRFTPVEQLFLLVLADQIGAALPARIWTMEPARISLPEALDRVLLDDPLRQLRTDELAEHVLRATESIDRLTSLAAALCGTLNAQVSLIGSRQTVASAIGTASPAGAVSPACESLCAVTMSARGVLDIPDTVADVRVNTMPPVTSGAVGAYLGSPLFIDDAVVGALCVYEPESRAWTPDHRRVIDELAACVSAELRLHVIAARDARIGLDTRDLQTVTNRIIRAESISEIATALCGFAGAIDAVAACVLAPDSFDHHGRPVLAVQTLPAVQHALTRLSTAASEQRTTVLLEIDELSALSPADTAVLATTIRMRRLAVVPLPGSNGTATLAFALPADVDTTRLSTRLAELAVIAASALDRAFTGEKLRIATARTDFLSTATAQLHATLDLDDILQRLTRIIVPALADGCLIHLTEGYRIRLCASSHIDRDIETTLAHDGADLTGILSAQELAPSTAQVTLAGIGTHEVRTIALGHGGKPIGWLSLINRDRPAPLSLATDQLIRDLAIRAAVAIENSRQHTKRLGDISALMQRLLPPTLPELPGFTLAAHYNAGDPTLEVGGDFYDVIRNGGNHFYLVIGDVCGRGAPAAAITGQARAVLRTLLEDGATPASALTRLNQWLRQTGPQGEFCTAAVVEVTHTEQTCRLRIASAGHPLPMHRHTGEHPHLTRPGHHGPMLGVVKTARYHDAEIDFHPGDSLVLFTDGVTEARDDEDFFGEQRLADVVTHALLDAGQISAAITTALRAFTRYQTDDVAILVLTRERPGTSPPG